MSNRYRIIAKPGLYWRRIAVEVELHPGKWMELQLFEKHTHDMSEAKRIRQAREYIRMREAGNEVLETFEARRP